MLLERKIYSIGGQKKNINTFKIPTSIPYKKYKCIKKKIKYLLLVGLEMAIML